jgi:poly-beta-hydroxyalkanoate depolymerase
MTDIDDLIREIDQSVEWFCDKVVEPIPTNKQDKEKIFNRMVTLGWLRKSEVETYNELTKNE